ncbi:MAG: DUF1501 domain-containing protein, partial [Bacteroidota bacterium]
MKRRQFLQAAPMITLPLLIKGFTVQAMESTPLLHLLGQQSLVNGRILVLIQLNGGNDGLNTVIALDRYTELTNARSNILISSDKVLKLNNTTATGLHPAMTEMQSMYNNGIMNIVQSVSYPNPSFSHFRAADIWLTGSKYNEYLSTGWLGRTIDAEYPDYPAVSPIGDDPLAIQIGTQASTMTQTSETNAAFTIPNLSSFNNFTSGQPPVLSHTPYNDQLSFLRLSQFQTSKSIKVIQDASLAGKNSVTYPTGNTLATNLSIVAKLISGGLKTPIYIVNHPNSFDTHTGQVDPTDHGKGNHATSLGLLSQAIDAFQKDLKGIGAQDRVTGMTFTEFGRRIKSNDSVGTDHGTAIPMFFFGTKVNPAITGSSPVLPATATVSDQIPMQFDFRQVYSTVLRDWFQLTDAELQSVFINATFTSLPIFNQAALPVTILAFTGNWKNGEVSLQWTTDKETNIDYYQVQRSEDGVSFNNMGFVTALNVTSKHDYTFYDSSLQQSYYYYRVKVVEKSGIIKYTSVLLLKDAQVVKGVRVKILPNPIDNWFTTSFQDKVTGNIAVRMLDLSGKEVWKGEQHANDAYNLTFTINKHVMPGVYVIQVREGDYEASTKVLL